MEYRIRQATPEDAEAVVQMHTLAHEECYSHLLPSDFFAARRASIPERTERRRAYLGVQEPRLIALDPGGRVVGLADAGPGRDADQPHALELYCLYTLRHTHGSGLGRALLEAAIGAAPAYLWVLEDNPRARAFYGKQGFRPDGEHNLLPEDWYRLPEMRMVREAAVARR
jgi:GNAT superfamily N-acetyltransferase